MTSSVGQLIPCYYDYLSPGEKVKGNCSIFSRTQPLQSTAFARMTEHVDFFFVPFDQLYSAFNSKFFNIQDINSSVLSEQAKNSNFPHITSKQVADFLNDIQSKQTSSAGAGHDKFHIHKGKNAIRLLESLGYASSYGRYGEHGFHGNDVHYSAFPLLAYHKIYNDYYRLSTFEAPKPKQYNYDAFATSPNLNYVVAGEALEIHYRAWKKTILQIYSQLHSSIITLLLSWYLKIRHLSLLMVKTLPSKLVQAYLCLKISYLNMDLPHRISAPC